jgi:plastocyanin
LHTVTAKDGSSDSNAFGRGDHYSKLFTEAGRWEFFCVIHRTMVGVVVVQ